LLDLLLLLAPLLLLLLDLLRLWRGCRLLSLCRGCWLRLTWRRWGGFFLILLALLGLCCKGGKAYKKQDKNHGS
jgi:hypothetical protein